MDRPPGALWLEQSESDYKIAEKLFDSDLKPNEYCHAIAKYQQSVEKAIKGLIAALVDADIRVSEPSYFLHIVEKHLSVLRRIPDAAANKSVQDRIDRLLTDSIRGDIKFLGALAPRKPSPGQMAQRNTEHPYQKADGGWLSPTDSLAFTEKELLRAKKAAKHIYYGTRKLVTALRHGEF